MSSVPQARALTRELLHMWGLHDHVDTMELLVTEVVTNAVRHGRGPLRLTLSARHTTLYCEVEDANPEQPTPHQAGEGDESGSGLTLIELVAGSWGSRPTDGGKAVWFELSTATGPGH
ncbi:ATP-binding protein [Streptomyces inhibens]|uniref:ATP-binding protein n=1 Tax=Streptomyces inhibens TaxID=2293571 RepID=UPI00379B5044